MFWVLSSGRSGSETIARTISQFRGCVCLHHPQPELVIEATAYFYGDSPREEIAGALRDTRQPLHRGQTYGEANLQLSLLIPLLDELYPESTFLWLIRDGRDTVASMYYRGWYDPCNERVPEHWHRARLQGDRTGDFDPETWASMGRFERCCWLWRKYNLVIESNLSNLDERRWMRIRLDQLRNQLKPLASFLGAKLPRKALVERHNVALQPVTPWEQWPSSQRGQFEKVCGCEMDRWFPEWRSPDGTWHPIVAPPADRPPLLKRARRFIRKAF
jgi:hypothetical protein